MELDQKFTFQTKAYQYVASPPDADISDTVLLFEPRMRHPALRVTPLKKLFKINFFLQIKKNDKNCENLNEVFQFFHFFHFRQNFAIRTPQFHPSNNL